MAREEGEKQIRTKVPNGSSVVGLGIRHCEEHYHLLNHNGGSVYCRFGFSMTALVNTDGCFVCVCVCVCVRVCVCVTKRAPLYRKTKTDAREKNLDWSSTSS
jgi:hypothetical protein